MQDDADPIVLRGIHAVIDNGSTTRAVAPLIDSIGKYDFLPTDEIVFTKIERTVRPIRPDFSYDNVQYSCEINGGNVSWKRQLPTNDIFWSDGSQPHTFIGYILPHEDGKSFSNSGDDWNYDSTHNVYYGSIGNPTVTNNDTIDYTGAPQLGEDQADPYSTEKLRKEDLLLTYDTNMQNEDAVAWIHFHHGLASVRVVVTITGFSSTGNDPDAESKVTDMVVSDMPTMYKWDNLGYQAAPLTNEDQNVLTGFTWNGSAPNWDQKKPMKLWQPRKYRGSEASRTFTFYGIVAPGAQDEVKMSFNVTYPDPLNPNKTLKKPYTATLNLGNSKKVEFRAGFCTNININLNHKDEKMTVGAEYMSWQLEDSPDEGTLRKNSTYLSYTDRDKITILGDEHATVDDATWLYTSTSGKVVDIYGNDGSEAKPFHICTADQLLSFANEVNGTRRTSITIKDLNNTDRNISGGFDFSGYNIKLDANLYMQANTTGTNVSWIGIGDETNPFNGNFQGEQRSIKRLSGKPLFVNIGPKGRVGGLWLEDVLDITSGGAAFAQLNKGVICACAVSSISFESFNINSATINEQSVAGMLVGNNEGIVMTCHSNGNFSTDAKRVGGLVGYNTGSIVVSYAATKGTTTYSGTDLMYRGIVAYNNYKPETLPDGKTPNDYGTLTYCFFDKDVANNVTDENTLNEVHGMTTLQMQSGNFIGTIGSSEKTTLNGNIHDYSVATGNYPKIIITTYNTTEQLNALKTHFLSHYYVHQVAAYPKVY